MSKYIYFQDAHFKGVNSINRKGNYLEDSLIKLEEMLQFAKKQGVQAIFDAGDLFDTAEPSYRVLDSVLDLIEKYKIPVYSIFGNHAMRFRSTENSRYTGLAHAMKRSEYMNYLDVYEDSDIYVKGFEYSHTIEEDIARDGIIIDESNKWKIAVTHGMILEKPFFKDVSHVVCKDIKTNVDLVLLGHYHPPFNVKTETCEFINVGSFTRNSISEMNIEPSFVVLDSETRSYEIVKLKSAKKGEEIFDKEKFEATKGKKKTIEEFLEAMKDTNIQGMDFKQQIKNIAKKNDWIKKEIVDYLLNKAEEIENE